MIDGRWAKKKVWVLVMLLLLTMLGSLVVCVFIGKMTKLTSLLVSYSNNHICGDISVDSGLLWRFVGVYGWSETAQKFKTRDLIRSFSSSNVPMIFGGDFNVVLCVCELEGVVRNERTVMVKFRKVMEDMEFRDLGYTGAWYTGERGKNSRTRVRERLDRFTMKKTHLMCGLIDAVLVRIRQSRSSSY